MLLVLLVPLLLLAPTSTTSTTSTTTTTTSATGATGTTSATTPPRGGNPATRPRIHRIGSDAFEGREFGARLSVDLLAGPSPWDQTTRVLPGRPVTRRVHVKSTRRTVSHRLSGFPGAPGPLAPQGAAGNQTRPCRINSTHRFTPFSGVSWGPGAPGPPGSVLRRFRESFRVRLTSGLTLKLSLQLEFRSPKVTSGACFFYIRSFLRVRGIPPYPSSLPSSPAF